MYHNVPEIVLKWLLWHVNFMYLRMLARHEQNAVLVLVSPQYYCILNVLIANVQMYNDYNDIVLRAANIPRDPTVLNCMNYCE